MQRGAPVQIGTTENLIPFSRTVVDVMPDIAKKNPARPDAVDVIPAERPSISTAVDDSPRSLSLRLQLGLCQARTKSSDCFGVGCNPVAEVAHPGVTRARGERFETRNPFQLIAQSRWAKGTNRREDRIIPVPPQQRVQGCLSERTQIQW